MLMLPDSGPVDAAALAPLPVDGVVEPFAPPPPDGLGVADAQRRVAAERGDEGERRGIREGQRPRRPLDQLPHQRVGGVGPVQQVAQDVHGPTVDDHKGILDRLPWIVLPARGWLTSCKRP